MSDEDFDLAGLADYLHVSQAIVNRMAERGQLPARKVAGQWRFARGEIHHWLERRIGGLDDAELAQLEGALERSSPLSQREDPASIRELLPLEAVAVPLAARTRSSVIASMVDLAAATGWVWDPQRLAEAVRQREDMFSTALDNGVALLHPRRPLANCLARPLLAFGRCDQGIPFGNQRGALTDLFFLICSVNDQGHLRTLARLSRLIGDATLLADLRAAPDAAAAHRLIVEREQRLLE